MKLATGFKQLDNTTQRFIEALSEGHVELQDLMVSHKDAIVEVVKAESKVQATATMAITDEVKTTQGMITEASSEAFLRERRQRLLKSLKFDSMGERLDQIKVAFEGTYGWIIQGFESAPDRTRGDLAGESLSPICPHRTKKLSWSCFPCWLESPKNKLYWVQGKAGSGKSTLMKFLVTNLPLLYPQKEGGDKDPLILSHFLWAAGSPLQRNLRGILLNLLYQLLSDNQHVLDPVLNTIPGLSLKEIDGDWTLEELERTMMESLTAIATRPVLMFLDGLDEFGSPNTSVADDPRTLLALVKRLSAIDNVKICVSSRPEPFFKNELGSFWNLRLQDLTRSDMDKYAKAQLLSNEIGDPENQKEYQELVDKICAMSEGVFLWTALAVRSLLRGLTNEDDISDLHARVEKMPKGLYALYKDMWERLNEDQDLYKKEAAQYFQLVVHWWRMPSHKFGGRCTIFHLLASLNPAISRACINNDNNSLPPDIEGACQKLGRRVEIRSAGLLEYGDQGSIDFIHRSALEFLTDTPEGQQIMAHDSSTANDLRSWLLQADVARAYLVCARPFGSPGNGSILRCGLQGWPDAHYFLADLQSNWDSTLPGDVQIMLLEPCRRILEENMRPFGYGSPLLDFAGYWAANGYYNLAIPFVQYPHFSPYVEVIRSQSYRSYLLVAALNQFGKFALYLHGTHLVVAGKAKVVEAILAEDPLLDFEDHASSATAESGLNVDAITLENHEKTALLVLLSALTFPWGWASPPELGNTKLSQKRPAFFKPVELVEKFFRRYPENEDKILLLAFTDCFYTGPMHWTIDVQNLGRYELQPLNDGEPTPPELDRWVLIECDTAYAAELLTRGWAVRENSAGENKENTMTDSGQIWRRAVGLKKIEPRILAFGGRGMYGTPTSCEDENRVISALENICLTKDGTAFSFPGLEESLVEMESKMNPFDEHWYLELTNANSFNIFVREFMRGCKKSTTSAVHWAWFIEWEEEFERQKKRDREKSREKREEGEKEREEREKERREERKRDGT